MRMNIAIAVIAASLLGSTAAISAPVSDGQIVVNHGQSKAMMRKAGMSNYNAGYNAGLQRHSYRTSNRVSYNRGYRDGSDNVRLSAIDYARNANTRYIGNIQAEDESDGRYNDANGYDGRYSYAIGNNGYGGFGGNYSSASYNGASGSYGRYAQGSYWNSQQRQNMIAYCSDRYRSFDPASGTFLAFDGNRYYCS